MGQISGVKLELANIADTLQNDLGKADMNVINARKNITAIVEGYNLGIKGYSEVKAMASKYLDMAKSLGEETMISRLSKIIKDSDEMIKVSNQAIAKAKSI